MSGVIPPIFASSIIMLPATLAQFSQVKGLRWLSDVALILSPVNRSIYSFMAQPSFSFFFYAALVFNPKDTSDNLKKSGALIPGLRPGEQTTHYIDAVMTRLTLVGALYLVLVCSLPQLLMMLWHVPFYFGGRLY